MNAMRYDVDRVTIINATPATKPKIDHFSLRKASV